MSSNESSKNISDNDYPIINEACETVAIGELESLIQMLQHRIDTRDPQIKKIKYPNLLMASLIELNYLVGMDRLKDSIALQVMRLIDGINNGEKSSKMLNTILYGPPGVGKTKVGIILAKIWFSLGYLKKPSALSSAAAAATANANTTPGITNVNTTITGSNQSNSPVIVFLLAMLFYFFAYISSGVSYLYEKVGMQWLIIMGLATLIIILLLYNNDKSYNYFTSVISPTSTTEEPKINDKKINEIKDRDIITVVSRQDFVAEYVGQTATKTKALLYANMGKVLFIDEAYSLINGERDQFGMEALTTLNLFMSEHADSIAIIFAGYKDIMKHGIFRIQPGLPRRCMWHFECEGYNGKQLSDIFLRQVYKDGWAIPKSDYEPIKNLISMNSNMFISYGGDTERLLFFSQLEASRHNMLNGSIERTGAYSGTYSGYSGLSSDSSEKKYRGKVITYNHVQHGLKRLEENNISSY